MEGLGDRLWGGWIKPGGLQVLKAWTVGLVAAVGGVAQPILPIDSPAPALDGRVVLRRKSTQEH